MAQLLDQFGNPIPPARIHAEIAGADPGKFRQQWTGMYQTIGLTPERVSAALRGADAGYEMPWLHLAEEIEEKDGHYASVLVVRKRAVQQLPITVVAAGEDAASQAHATFLREWLKTGALQLAIFDMMDAVSKSFAVHEIEWLTRPDRIWPKRLIWRQPFWFGIDKHDGDTVMLRDGQQLDPLPAWKFIVHKSRYKSGHLIRGGIARVAVWTWMFKAFTMKDWATFVQNYGQPIRLGRYGAGATERDKEALWDAVSNIAGDMAAIVPKGMELEFVGVKDMAGSAGVYAERCKYLDQQLSKIVLGQTTTVDAVSGGHAVSQEHEKIREMVERADGVALSVTTSRQLVPVIIDANFGPQDNYPTIVIGRPDEMPIGEIITAVDKLGKQGLVVQASEIRRRLGMPDPAPGEALVGRMLPEAGAPQDKEPEDKDPNQKPDPLEMDEQGEPADKSLNAAIKRLQARRTREPFDGVQLAVDRLARDAAGALGGMTEEVRNVLENATSLQDAATQLATLQLDQVKFAEALGRAMALAHLAGQAGVLDETQNSSTNSGS